MYTDATISRERTSNPTVAGIPIKAMSRSEKRRVSFSSGIWPALACLENIGKITVAIDMTKIPSVNSTNRIEYCSDATDPAASVVAITSDTATLI